MADVIDVKQLLKVQHVPVVQALDFLGLEGLLKQLLQGQKASEEQLEKQKAEIDALKAAQADQPQASDAGYPPMPQLQDHVTALDKRLAELEAQCLNPGAAQPAFAPDQPSATVAGDRVHGQDAVQHDSSAAAGSVALASHPGFAADLQGIRSRQQQLEKQLADVAAANKGLQQQVSVMQDSKANRADVRDMLADGLKGKADSAAVAQLKTQLADKADRSELDALLNTLSSTSSSPASQDDSSSPPGQTGSEGQESSSMPASEQQPPLPSSQHDSGQAAAAASITHGTGSSLSAGSRRGTVDREGGPDLAQQLSKLQLQLALLQDRLNKKADSQAVAELTGDLHTASDQLADQAKVLQDIQAQLSTASQDLSSLQHNLDNHAGDSILHSCSPGMQPQHQLLMPAQHATPADQAAACSTACVTGLESVASDAADTCNRLGTGALQLLAALAARVAALEAALTETQVAANTAAAQQQQQPRRVPGEQAASSRLVQALAAQLSELSHEVARLADQAQPGSTHAASVLQLAKVDPKATAAVDGKLTGGNDASAQDEPADADAADAGVAAGAPGSAGVSGFAAVLAAELDGRLTELEQFVQELSTIKADQAGLQDLRSLLADTATQADTDHLRRQLSSQQSILDRLMRQLSSSSNTSRGSRPQSAAGVNHQKHAAGAVTSEYSFMGAASGAGAGSAGSSSSLHADARGVDSSSVAAWGVDREADAPGVESQGPGGFGALQAQLQAHQDSLEQLAEAVSLLATGQAAAAAAAPPPPAAGPGSKVPALQVGSDGVVDLAAGRGDAAAGDASVPETPNLRFQTARAGVSTGSPLAAAAGIGAARPATPLTASFGRLQGVGHAGGVQGRGSAAPGVAAVWQQGGVVGACEPHVARLRRLLQTGQVGRKMDYFDPTLLQKMAQRLAAVDALLRNGAAGTGSAGASSSGHQGDVDSKLKRLAADVRQLKDRMAELAAGATGGQGGWRGLGQASDGDHSMLSGKPLGGYRCMACDRPLTTLEARSGPYLPTGQLPVSLVSGAELAAGAGAVLGKVRGGWSGG